MEGGGKGDRGTHRTLQACALRGRSDFRCALGSGSPKVGHATGHAPGSSARPTRSASARRLRRSPLKRHSRNQYRPGLELRRHGGRAIRYCPRQLPRRGSRSRRGVQDRQSRYEDPHDSTDMGSAGPSVRRRSARLRSQRTLDVHLVSWRGAHAWLCGIWHSTQRKGTIPARQGQSRNWFCPCGTCLGHLLNPATSVRSRAEHVEHAPAPPPHSPLWH